MYAQYYLITFTPMHLVIDFLPVIDDPDESLAETAFRLWQECAEKDDTLEVAEFTVFDKLTGSMTLDTWTRQNLADPDFLRTLQDDEDTEAEWLQCTETTIGKQQKLKSSSDI